MIEEDVLIPTEDGAVETFVCHPDRDGPWPAVIFYMDAPGIREELRDMARRLATVGYCVLLPNLYYRHGRGTTCGPDVFDPASIEHQRMWTLLSSLSNEAVVRDTAGLLAFIDGSSKIKPGPIGCFGYCMSGPFAVTAAARFPDRLAAAASLYGVGLVTDKPDSPHHVLNTVKAELYFAFGEKDSFTPPQIIDAIRGGLDDAKAAYEIEVYPGVDHGFAFPGRQTYHKPSAERHWERLIALFRRTLG